MKAIKIKLALRAADPSAHGARVLLHMVAAVRDHKWKWHAAGIVREFSR